MKTAPPVRPANAVEAPSLTGNRQHSHVPSRVLRATLSLLPFRVSAEGADNQDNPHTTQQPITAE